MINIQMIIERKDRDVTTKGPAKLRLVAKDQGTHFGVHTISANYEIKGLRLPVHKGHIDSVRCLGETFNGIAPHVPHLVFSKAVHDPAQVVSHDFDVDSP